MKQPVLETIYSKLLEHYGPQHWWPAETPFEVVVGALLTQNTAWGNVEMALANLKGAAPLTPRQLASTPREALETLIRPAGFFRQKAARLSALARLLEESYGGDVAALCAGDLDEARERLLDLHGIGPETADSILLYAAGRASFVVDAYTRRLFSRLALLGGQEPYAIIRAAFMTALPLRPELFNEYHALIVVHAKDCCRKRRPDCPACPLRAHCPAAGTFSP